MTAGVKELTDRASNRPSRPTPTLTPARELRAFTDALQRLGYDVSALLAAAGLAPSDLEDPDALLPCAATTSILARACQERPLKNLALRLAAETPLGAYPLLDYLVLSSDTVGHGFRQLIRYYGIVNAPVTLEVVDDEDPIRVVAASPGNPFALEYVLSLNVLHFRRETEDRLHVACVSFTHRPDDVSEFERILRCPVDAEAGWSGIALPGSSWRLPLRRRDPTLRGVLQSQADAVTASLAAGRGITFEVRRLMATRIAGGETRIGALARQLATTPRTLQRRLAAEGSSYQGLLDQTRREAAESYLTDSTLSAAEVAYLLGYSEPAAFHRAFKRWCGSSPRDFRESRRQRPGPRSQ